MPFRKIYFLLSLVSILILGIATQTFAQGGGKAMPKRIKFAKGKTSKTITDRMRNGEEQEFVIDGRKGQELQIKISSKPRGKYHSFSILGIDGVDFATDYDTNYTVTTKLPESGDYLIRVVKRPTKRNKTARYYLMVKITD